MEEKKNNILINFYFQGKPNRLFSSCLKSQFQCEAKCETIMKINFYSHSNITHLHKKGFAFGLVLKVRVLGPRECSITINLAYFRAFSITQFNLKKLTRFFPNIGHHIFILVIESKTCTLNFTEFE